jgi:hypothetical protein
VDANPDPDIMAPHGPFKSIYELQRVIDLRPGSQTRVPTALGYPQGTSNGYDFTAPSFINGYGTTPLPNTLPITADPDDALGDFGPANYPGMPPTMQTDHLRSDYKERFLNLTRISNLITTRSDSFTVYILVQGWRNAGSTDPNNPPVAVIQKRAAYVIDRSRAIQSKPTVTRQPFANN